MAEQRRHSLYVPRRALSLFRELGDRFYEATILTHLGDNQRSAGNAPEAATAWQQALAVFDDLHHPDADHVRIKLWDAAPPGPASQGRPSAALGERYGMMDG